MSKKKSTRSPKKKHTLLYWVIGILVCCLIVPGCYLVYWHYHKTSSTTTTSTSRNIYSPPVANPKVPGGSTSTNSSQNGGIYSSKGTAPSTPTLSSSVQPATPVGEFVSDHHPNLSGKPAPNTETSTCTTTAGATCQIRFTMGSVVKSLPIETADSNGNASWSWTLQSIGLTQGTWQVTAVAANGGKTATANDVNQLVVEP